jgi:hypothetical protein
VINTPLVESLCILYELYSNIANFKYIFAFNLESAKLSPLSKTELLENYRAAVPNPFGQLETVSS